MKIINYKKHTMAIIATTLFVGCSASVAAPNSNEFGILSTYMAQNNMDMNKVMDRKTWIPHAAVLAENISDYYILDIRDGDIAPKNGILDFKDGHIPGAHNTTFKNILKYAKEHNAGDNILVVSYDGQDAAAAAVALRLSGYPNTKVLKFGMSGWNSKFNVWTAKQSNFAATHKNWTKSSAPKPKTYSSTPQLNTGKTNGKDILAVRVDTFLEKGYQGMIAQKMLDNPDEYYIVNQGTAKAYGKYGRIAGANQFNWPMIKTDKKHGSLANYPTDKSIVQYCWTGHAAISVASWMNILGYDAIGVKYGTNSMIIDEMTKKKFKKPADLPYVTD